MAGVILSQRCGGCSGPYAPGDLDYGGLCKECRDALERGWKRRGSSSKDAVKEERLRIRRGLLAAILDDPAIRYDKGEAIIHENLLLRALDTICPEEVEGKSFDRETLEGRIAELEANLAAAAPNPFFEHLFRQLLTEIQAHREEDESALGTLRRIISQWLARGERLAELEGACDLLRATLSHCSIQGLDKDKKILGLETAIEQLEVDVEYWRRLLRLSDLENRGLRQRLYMPPGEPARG